MDGGPWLTFGGLLRRYRDAAGLTQEELAARSGLSPDAISLLERGERCRPRAYTIQKLAAALGLAPHEQAALSGAIPRTRASRVAREGAVARPAPTQRMVPLAGRGRERALLERHLRGQGPPLLLLAGEPGIGKSRLLDEVAALATADDWCVIQGGCQRRGGQEPYAPVLNAVQRFVRAQPRARLRTQLQGCAWLVRLLPELAASPIEPLPTWSLPPDQDRRLMFDAVSRFLTNVAEPSGTLVLLDDLQWAGADALDLLASITHATATQPLRVIGAYRDTEVRPEDPLSVVLADLAHAGLAMQYRVGPLTPGEATDLLHALLAQGGAPAIPSEQGDELRERLLRRAGGVPFFLISCAEMLTGQALEHTGDDALPWTLTQSIQQRVATLPPVGQEMLAMAAVLGRVFSPAVLIRAMARPAEEIIAALETACRLRLLEEDGTPSHRFVHDVIREVVEGDLGTARRLLLHRRAAEALEAQPGDTPPEALAYHYGRSEEWERALLYLVRAGDKALAANAPMDARDLYAEALAACERLDGTVLTAAFDIVEKRLFILTMLVDHSTIEKDIAWLLSRAQRLGDRRVEAGVLVLRGNYEADAKHLMRKAEATLRTAQALAQECGDQKQYCRASLSLIDLLWTTDRRAEAEPLQRVALDLAATMDDPDVQRAATAVIILTANWSGRFGEALQALRRPHAVFEVDTAEPNSSWIDAVVRGGGGDYAEALRQLNALHAKWLQFGSDAGAAACLNTLGWIHGDLQDFHRSVELNRQGVDAALTSGEAFPEKESNARLNLGDSLCALGRLDDAEEQFRIVERTVRNPRPQDDYMLWRYAQHWCHSAGELALARGDPERALALADECLARAERSDSRKNSVKALRLRGQVFLAQGKLPKADRELERGLALACEVGNPPQLWQALVALGDLREAQGRTADAIQACQEALGVVERVAAGLDAWPGLRQTLLASPLVEHLRQRAAVAGQETRRQGGACGKPGPPRWARSERQARALACMREAGAISPREYAAAQGVSPDTALRDLQDLAGRGLVRAEGSTRDRRYTLAETQAVR